jgi:hypothetical protein
MRLLSNYLPFWPVHLLGWPDAGTVPGTLVPIGTSDAELNWPFLLVYVGNCWMYYGLSDCGLGPT